MFHLKFQPKFQKVGGNSMDTVLNWARKTILITIGVISLVVGIIGIFVPFLPTVPFLILTAICFILATS
jgi:uncharacterized membrane protein YdbT with pleckstrin-like domain